MCEFKKLIGKTLISCTGKVQDDEMIFECSDGEKYELYHNQDCCESVYIEDICGDLNDILNSPIISAEESTSYNPNASESGTWTFYKIDTIKGGVTIRWNGESNGYYSESVSFEKIERSNN